MNYTDSIKAMGPFAHDDVGEIVLTQWTNTDFRKWELFANLSDDDDIVIASFDEAKAAFKDKNTATLNEKRSLLDSLLVYVRDDTSVEDDTTQITKVDILGKIQKPSNELSDTDVTRIFSEVYFLLWLS